MNNRHRPLRAHEIVAGYSAPGSIDLASRNAMIINWLRQCEGLVLNLIRREYAAHLGCDISEIPEDLADYMLEPEELEWLWGRYGKDIRE